MYIHVFTALYFIIQEAEAELKLHIFMSDPLKFVFPGGWRVKSAQTDGENCCGAPEGKDACCARSDQAEFCSLRGEGVGG